MVLCLLRLQLQNYVVTCLHLYLLKANNFMDGLCLCPEGRRWCRNLKVGTVDICQGDPATK